MPVLSNPKQERFAQELAKGRSQIEAYVRAGYKANDGHAARLAGKGRIAERVEELLGRAAARAEITVADIARQLDADRAFARRLKQAAPMVSATMGKAKVLGLIRDKVEHSGSVNVHIAGADADL